MIEILNKDQKLEGYVNGKQYLDKRKRLQGYLEDKSVKDKEGITISILREDGIITYSADLGNEEMGALKENKIFNIEGTLMYEFVSEKREIVDRIGKTVLILKGPTREIEEVTNKDFFGLVSIFLELFA